MQALQVLLPVDAVVEPVEDQEQDGDRDERDDGLEPLSPAGERAEHRLRDDPRDDARGERDADADQQRPSETSLRADHARHQRGEDQHRLETLAEDDDRAVRDDRDARARTGADPRLGVRERLVQRGRVCASSAADALRFRSCTSPSTSPSPYQKSLSTSWKRLGAIPRSRCSGPELEDAVRLEARLLGSPPLALRRRPPGRGRASPR